MLDLNLTPVIKITGITAYTDPADDWIVSGKGRRWYEVTVLVHLKEDVAPVASVSHHEVSNGSAEAIIAMYDETSDIITDSRRIEFRPALEYSPVRGLTRSGKGA